MNIICLIGKSGCGKKDVAKTISKLGYTRIISYTTREQCNADFLDNDKILHKAEKNGDDYNFVSIDEFNNLIKNNMLMEYNKFKGNMYGLPRPIDDGNYVVIVEPNGYESIKQQYGNSVTGVYLDTIFEKENEEYTDEVEELFNKCKINMDIIITYGVDITSLVAKILSYVKYKQRVKR